ncbi:MAG: ATP-grasp domain-containing protein [Thermoplasmata archaeon]
MKVLITDADYHNALAAVRALGKSGAFVVSCSHKRFAQSFYSNYSMKNIRCPPPTSELFSRYIRDIIDEMDIDVVIPIGYDTTISLSRDLEVMGIDKRIPVAEWNRLEIASDKEKTVDFARELGIPIPKTFRNVDDVDSFPVVVKGKKGAGRIRYVNSISELMAIDLADSIIQEYIRGEGFGFFALFNHGKERAIFMHRRIREFPITGGPSTCAESIYDEKLLKLGMKILRALKWHGVAMIEMKKDIKTGDFKLIEINPKFWGSLDLAISSGINFPYLLSKMTIDGDIEPILEYKIGVRFRWVFPNEIMYMISNPAFAPRFFSEFLDKNSRTNIQIDDLLPNMFQMIMTLPAILRRMKKGGLKAPHGTPRLNA